MAFPTHRPRRLRHLSAMRDLVRETRLSVNDFILPLFIHHDPSIKHPISTMPGWFPLGID